MEQVLHVALLRHPSTKPSDVLRRWTGDGDEKAGDPSVEMLWAGDGKERKGFEGMVGVAAALAAQHGAELPREEGGHRGALAERNTNSETRLDSLTITKI